MKAFYVVVLLIFLASCGVDQAVEEAPVTSEVVEQAQEEVDAAVEELPEEVQEFIEENNSEEEISQSAESSEVVVLDATYTNPKTEVDMEIEYQLDSDGNIADITVAATTYDLSGFNTEIQSQVIWKSLEEASEVYVSGSSLTSAAYNDAMKSVIN